MDKKQEGPFALQFIIIKSSGANGRKSSHPQIYPAYAIHRLLFTHAFQRHLSFTYRDNKNRLTTMSRIPQVLTSRVVLSR
eukprot:scaffold10903_cov158-Skeletonema_marinoi.AAC.3